MLTDISLLISKELSKVNDYINRCLYTENPVIQQVIQYSFQQQGKQLRPQLVLIIASVLGNDITEKTRRGAALVSLLHHASLIHDDVVDEATYRRHKKTVNAIWGNKLAVLFGDYVLANSLQIAIENQDYDFLPMLTLTTQTMSEGEILQLRQAQEIMASEATYLEIIQKKTASLLAACCAMGAMSVSASQEQIEIMYAIGEQIGMAFQLSDDLIDYGATTNADKATFMDLKAHTLTLPLIYALQQASASETQYILSLVKSCNTADTKSTQEILSLINRIGGIKYTLQKINFYQQKALDLIKTHLRPSAYTDALVALIHKMILTK
ncbi:MAG: polyprenyl synthetase family protein [Candidatus Amoebophilus sp.]